MFQTVSMSMKDVAVEVCVCVSCVLREIRKCDCMDCVDSVFRVTLGTQEQ